VDQAWSVTVGWARTVCREGGAGSSLLPLRPVAATTSATDTRGHNPGALGSWTVLDHVSITVDDLEAAVS
jgi:hypothetical protein